MAERIGNHNVGHRHCNVCGACLLFNAQIHACPGDKPIDPEVLEVFRADTRPKDGRRTAPKNGEDVPRGFQEIRFRG